MNKLKQSWWAPNMIKRVVVLLFTVILNGLLWSNPGVAQAIKVEIVRSDDGFQLLRAGEPYVIKGVGREFGDIAAIASHGGNSFRNWTSDNAAEILDLAHEYGITVALCLPVQAERWGFDYGDAAAVAGQLAAMREEVLKYRDHPALLAWIIGNELNFDYRDSRVYDAVNEISNMIHELDPNHPTTTTVAGLGLNVVEDLQTRATDLDFISFQVYGELANLPGFLNSLDLDKPIMVTEWGPVGHWEIPPTSWGAAVEMNSSAKADVYESMYEENIRPLLGRIIGSYAFLWGQKQERTPTWYGMFTETGEETATVDVMHRIWNGDWPGNRAPVVRSLSLNAQTADQNVRLRPGREYRAVARVFDPDGDDLRYHWELKPESQAQQVGGDFEQSIDNLDLGIDDLNSRRIRFAVPEQPGAYRLFMYAYDEHSHAAHANIPFLVID